MLLKKMVKSKSSWEWTSLTLWWQNILLYVYNKRYIEKGICFRGVFNSCIQFFPDKISAWPWELVLFTKAKKITDGIWPVMDSWWGVQLYVYCWISERSTEIPPLIIKVSLPVVLSVQHNQNCDNKTAAVNSSGKKSLKMLSQHSWC